jgi:hypothetical protein
MLVPSALAAADDLADPRRLYVHRRDGAALVVHPLSVFGPNVVVATSAASRPRAISTRPMRGTLWRASGVPAAFEIGFEPG